MQFKNRIVCAANKVGDDLILGIRHCDLLMNRTKELCRIRNADWNTAEQGFVDKFGVFQSRTDAWKIAVKANQIFRLVSGQTKDSVFAVDVELYSENLY